MQPDRVGTSGGERVMHDRARGESASATSLVPDAAGPRVFHHVHGGCEEGTLLCVKLRQMRPGKGDEARLDTGFDGSRGAILHRETGHLGAAIAIGSAT
ncbi:MAG: hypothetical protein MUD07_00125 [Burkholderiaceae bacterium]|nr:hypothetical protein [Burkholderiaceae bacterium]